MLNENIEKLCFLAVALINRGKFAEALDAFTDILNKNRRIALASEQPGTRPFAFGCSL